MRVAIIRGDLPGPVFMADLEPTSQVNPPTEPMGQTRYVARPTPTTVGAALSTYAPATLLGTTNITLNVVINGGNQTLRVKTSSAASFTAYTVATGTYTTVASLAAAVTTALAGSGVEAIVSPTNPLRLVIRSTAKGADTYVAYDSTGNGSTFNTPGGLGAAAANFTVPTAAAVITALSPVGGPVDVSAATIRTNVGAGLTDAQVAGVADSIAPQFIETDVAIKSFQVGNLSKYRSAQFNPDPNRLPAVASGAALVVLADDGTTTFTSTVPTITNGQVNTPSAGKITITGTGLGTSEQPKTVTVKFTTSAGVLIKTLLQGAIEAGGGTISPTSIVIPASLTSGIAAGNKVQVLYTSLASNVFTLV
jgi:hypothetical protein